VNNSEAAQVREIFALHNSGMGSYAIAQKLNDEGFGSKYGPWHEQVIRKLLTSQTYIGMIRHRDQWLQGNHEPIIDRETFDRAQRITEQRKIDNELHHRRFGVNAAYLSGFVVCGKCGMKYSHKHTTSGGKRFEYYGCSSRFRRVALNAVPCDNKIWRGPELEGLIFDEIRKLRLESAVMVKDDHLDTLSQRRVELQKQIERLIDLYAQGSVSRGTLEAKIDAINEQLTKVDHQIESIEAERRDRLTRSDAQALAQDLSGILDRGDYHEIRALISALIENIIVNGDDITIFWRFS
jgi:site-specific DNA recombinase